MILEPLLLILFLYLFVFGIFNNSRYKSVATILISISQIVNFLNPQKFYPIVQTTGFLGFAVGFYGLQTKVPIKTPLIIFVSSFLFLQILGYGFNIILFKNSLLTLIVTILLLVVSSMIVLVKQKDDSKLLK